MHDLLDGAVEHARASGATVIEAYPVEAEGWPPKTAQLAAPPAA
jgi:hypothetical protein